MFKVVEVDNSTGATRELDNYQTDPWTDRFTEEQAKETVAWREKNITAKYSYRILDASNCHYNDGNFCNVHGNWKY